MNINSDIDYTKTDSYWKLQDNTLDKNRDFFF